MEWETKVHSLLLKMHRPHLSGYHQNNSLLFQFILSELVRSYRVVQEMNEHAKELSQSFLQPLLKKRSDGFLLAIKECINKLVGSSQEYYSIFFCHQEEGFLAKLKYNSVFFSQNCGEEDKEALGLHRYAHRAWLLCLRSLDAIREIEHEILIDHLRQTKATDSDYQPLLQTLQKINGSMHRIARLVVKLLLRFRDDENVVFFLLRYKEQFDEFFGKHFVFKLFSQMFPKGVQEANRFLLKKYTSRGFENLLPIIASKISELETCQK